MNSLDPNPTQSLAYVALGGNLGDVRGSFRYAVDRFAKVTGKAVRTSRLYRTAPWGDENQPDYLNMVLEIRWESSPRDLLELALSIETECGRTREKNRRWGPRTLDVDLLIVGEIRVDDDDLKLPHPRMRERTFVLAPLADLAGQLVPPGWPMNVRDTLKRREDYHFVIKSVNDSF